ncbi:MAG: protease PrsW [Cytophagales bacterium]|nr:MAG: protease PrsW [Cytophagales bacterium]
MIIIYSIIAIYIAWIWVDYFRLIDIYEKESLKYFILTFILGCGSTQLVLWLNKYVLDSLHNELTGDFVNDFLYSVFSIGLVEESAKTIPFLIVYFLFRKQFNEPIDYLVFICISALGFSAAENVLYFQNKGPDIINSRAILCSIGHMFDTSLIAYGIIRYKFHPKKEGIIVLFKFFFLAALSHGFYDFWLIYEGTKPFGWLITILFFLVTISLFVTILNNALNNSSFFTYKKVVNSDKVIFRLLIYYGIVFLTQFILLIFLKNISYAFLNLNYSIFFTGIIVAITCIRLGRFKLIKGRWEKLIIEFPFRIFSEKSTVNKSSGATISIKGDPFNEYYVTVFYEEYFILKPLSKTNTYIGHQRLAFIEKKVFFKNDETYYLTKVFHDFESGVHEKVLLKPKRNDSTMVNKKYPIVAVLRIENLEELLNNTSIEGKFKFKEWAFMKPIKKD